MKQIIFLVMAVALVALVGLGKEWPPPKAAGNYGESPKVDSNDYTSPVGSFAGNKLGLHDMGGDVWEWCEDKYSPTSSYRVLRGASWGTYYPDFLLSSYRFLLHAR